MMSHEQQQPILVYADGSVSPRHAGAGVVVQNALGHVVLVANRTLNGRVNNNEAEYHGLLLGLQIARGFVPQTVEFRLDSEVVVNQMLGRFAVNSRALKPLHREACVLARHLPAVAYVHIPRDENAVAHALAVEAAMGRQWCSKGVPCSG
jgi:probable phosphoglycerate mutase